MRADRLVLALISVLRTLIHELHKERAIELASALDASTAAHRERGDPNELADAIEMITQFVSDSISPPPKTKRDRH